MEVARLNMLKASHLNQVYALEELVYRKYPEEITRLTERIAGYGQDVALAAAHPKAQEGFCGMEVDGKHYAEKEDAGKAIIDVCTRMTGSDAVLLGQYRGFSMVLAYDGRSNEYRITLKGTLSHTVTLGADVFAISPAWTTLRKTLQAACRPSRTAWRKPKPSLKTHAPNWLPHFAREEELAEKAARLKELNILLNMMRRTRLCWTIPRMRARMCLPGGLRSWHGKEDTMTNEELNTRLYEKNVRGTGAVPGLAAFPAAG